MKKNISTLRKALVILTIVISYGCKAQITQTKKGLIIQQNLINLNSNLIGIWISEEDPNWTMEFTPNGDCYWYYTNEDTDNFIYSISTTSPQCGQSVKTGGLEDFYLKLINLENNDIFCYEILGVNNESFSISTIGLGVKNYLFLRK